MTLPESIAPIWSMPYSMKSIVGLGSRRRAEWLDFEREPMSALKIALQLVAL
jgi:hypothetical protein